MAEILELPVNTLREALIPLTQVEEIGRLGYAVSQENTRYHGGEGEETALVHTWRVVQEVDDIAQGKEVFPDDDESQECLTHFIHSPIPTEITVWETMLIALAEVHDIGKGPRLEDDGVTISYGIFESRLGNLTPAAGGQTTVKGHEQRSFEMLPSVFTQMEQHHGVYLSDGIKTLLAELTMHHGDAYPLIVDEMENHKDMQGEERTRYLIEHMDQVWQEKGVTDPAIKIGVFINVIADLEAGRINPGPYDPNDFGFTNEQKIDARTLLAHYLTEASGVNVNA